MRVRDVRSGVSMILGFSRILWAPRYVVRGERGIDKNNVFDFEGFLKNCSIIIIAHDLFKTALNSAPF